MAYKVSVTEVEGGIEDLQTAIQATLSGLTIAAGSEPSISVVGGGTRRKIFIMYRDG